MRASRISRRVSGYVPPHLTLASSATEYCDLRRMNGYTTSTSRMNHFDDATVVRKLWSNPNLLIVQRLLAAPTFQASGRWVAIEPNSKGAFLLPGPDVMPDALQILHQAGSGLDPEVEIAIG